MKTCKSCGTHNTEIEEKCFKCGALLDAERAYEANALAESRLEGKGGALESGKNRIFATTGRARVRGGRIFEALRPERVDRGAGLADRKIFRAAFLSFIPGCGQLYNHQPKKAVLFILIWIVGAVICALTFYHPYANYIAYLYSMWILFVFHDGFVTAIEINQRYWNYRRSLTAYVGWIFLFGVSMILANFFLSFTALKFRYISENALAPTIAIKDRVAIDIMSYRFRDPRVGEIVYYDPGKVEMDMGKNVYYSDPQNGLERVVGGPGQVFERRDGDFFLDGVPVPEGRGPIYPDELQMNFRLEAPPDHFIVLRTSMGEHFLQVTAPKMNNALTLRYWDESAIVPREDIVGRVWFTYHPPPRRRFFE